MRVNREQPAACMASEPACFSAIAALYQSHLPKTRVVEIEEIQMECAMKYPYHKVDSNDILKFKASSKYASYRVPVTSVTLQCRLNGASAFLVAMSSLWVLFFMSVVAVIAGKVKSYSPLDFRFFIALDAAVFSCKLYHIQTFGIAVLFATFLSSFIYSDAIDFMNAFLFGFVGLKDLYYMFETPLSIRGGTCAFGNAEGSSKWKYNHAAMVLSCTTSPVCFKLPKSHISIFELNGMLVSPTSVLQKIETLMLEESLCKTDSLNAWGDGPAISRIMQMLVIQNPQVVQVA
jgi:hypothetical protein